ncbi:MAG: short-chain dehydrogenase [Chitinophagaceae bacterium]
MTNDQIEKFMLAKYLDKSAVQINFKARPAIKGLFIKTADYAELRSKNLWRIVNQASIEEYKKSGDINLARIFNGVEMTRLEVAS